MIIKKGAIPYELQQLKALLYRLPSHHPKREEVEEAFAKKMTGYKGERAIDYPLSFLPSKKYMILHDLRLFEGTHYFQMDVLVVSSRFYLILEVKNISGTLIFDTVFKQLIRQTNEREEAFPDPIMQISRQASQLKMWLHDRQFPELPIETRVVVSHPHSVIKAIPSYSPHLAHLVIRSETIQQAIQELEAQYRHEGLPQAKLKRVSKQLLKHHQPLNMAILKRFSLTDEDIVKGVRCPNCDAIPMLRHHGKWLCSSCSYESKDAHIASLHDFCFLYQDTITNQQFRTFLQLSSVSIASRLLHSMNLHHTGANKKRTYHLPF